MKIKNLKDALERLKPCEMKGGRISMVNLNYSTETKRLELASENGNVCVRTYLIADINEDFNVCCDMHYLSSVVRRLCLFGEELNISASEKAVKLSCGCANVTVPVFANSIPKKMLKASDNYTTFEANGLSQDIYRVIHATNINSNVFGMTQIIAMAVDDTGIHVAATDGMRIALRGKKGAVDSKMDLSFPALVLRSVAGAFEIESLMVPENREQVVFKGDKTIAFVSTCDVSFLNIKNYINGMRYTIDCNKWELVNSLKLALVVSDGPVNLNFNKNEIIIKRPGVDDLNIRIGCKADIEEPLGIAYNPNFFIDALTTMEGEEIQIQTSAIKNRPCLIKGSQETQLEIVLPVVIA